VAQSYIGTHGAHCREDGNELGSSRRKNLGRGFRKKTSIRANNIHQKFESFTNDYCNEISIRRGNLPIISMTSSRVTSTSPHKFDHKEFDVVGTAIVFVGLKYFKIEPEPILTKHSRQSTMVEFIMIK